MSISASPLSVKKLSARLLMSTLGIISALGIGELIAHHMDDGAFPHVNIFEADERLGVRMTPRASQRISFGGNPTSTLTTNSQGYRGAEWSQATEDDVIILGDSQVFGLGVNDDETFSARLATLSGRPIRNYGMVTYGPEEYTALLEAELESRRAMNRPPPRQVFYVINMANDPFEFGRPNLQRHKLWDGWAVRAESAPLETMSFPGRSWLYNRSHLFYAARRLFYTFNHEENQVFNAGLPSEGGWEDLAHQTGVQLDDLRERNLLVRDSRALDDQHLKRLIKEVSLPDTAAERQYALARAARSNPNDILAPYRQSSTREGKGRKRVKRAPPRRRGRRGMEMSRSARARLNQYQARDDAELLAETRVNSELIRRGVEARRALEGRLSMKVKTPQSDVEPVDQLRDRSEYQKRHREYLSQIKRERVKLQRLRAQRQLNLPMMRRLKDLQERYQTKITVVALPMDMQVDPKEALKYGIEPQDTSAATDYQRRLLLSADSEGLGHLDLLDPLRAQEGSLFLDGDLHLNPSGHQVVAETLHRALSDATGESREAFKRTAIPSLSQWRMTPALKIFDVKRVNPKRCEVVSIDDWVKIHCRSYPRARQLIALYDDHQDESLITWQRHGFTLLIAVTPERARRLLVKFRDRRRVVQWLIALQLEPDQAEGWRPVIDVREVRGDVTELLQRDHLERVELEQNAEQLSRFVSSCEAHQREHQDRNCALNRRGLPTETCESSCVELFGDVTSSACFTSYTGDQVSEGVRGVLTNRELSTNDLKRRSKLLSCVEGEQPALCPEGERPGGASGFCYPTCSAERSCERGRCVERGGRGVCVSPKLGLGPDALESGARR